LIKTVTEEGTIVNNSYNAEGYRTGKEVNGKKTYYLYEVDKIILEVDEAGNQKARNVYGTNLILRTADGETYYYLYNGHADVTALVTREGTIAATYYYDAFENILESTGEVNNNIRYSGYQYEEETGLYYVNARMYDPKTARFLQEDTYTGDPNDPLSLNLYTYCSNNPLIYLDPTGHSLEEIGNFFKTVAGKAGKAIKEAKESINEENFGKIGGFIDKSNSLGEALFRRVKANANSLYNMGKGSIEPALSWVDLGIGWGLNKSKYIDDQTYGYYKENIWGKIEHYSENAGIINPIADLVAMGIGEKYLRSTFADRQLIDNYISISKNKLKTSFPEGIKSFVEQFKTITNKEKLYNYFLNVNATDEQLEEFATHAYTVGFMLYGGVKTVSGIKPKMSNLNAKTFSYNANGTMQLAAASTSSLSVVLEGGLLGNLAFSAIGSLGGSSYNGSNEKGSTVREGAGSVFKPVNNMKMKTSEALDAASEWLGKGYKDMGNGRFVSADGKRVVRMGDADILGKHGGGKHMNFEELVPNPNKPGKMQVSTNYHIYLTD